MKQTTQNKKRINILVDFGESFVDPNGSFYCGTTEEQIGNAVKVSKHADLTVYVSDAHTAQSPEFTANGGLYPAHNLIAKDHDKAAELGVKEGKSVSPQLTKKLHDLVKDKRSGLIVPRHVFFQDYNGGEPKPGFTFEDVEKTYGVPRLKPQDFLDGKIEYVVNAKHMFSGAAHQSTEWMGQIEGVPDLEMNIFTLLKQMYGQGEDIAIDITGVVMGICVYSTATNVRQIFPRAEVNVIADGCTHLAVSELGIDNEEQGDDVVRRMCQQIGVGYLTTEQYLEDRL